MSWLRGAPPVGEPWWSELEAFDRRKVPIPRTNAADQRYAHYRKRGLPRDEARQAALAWERNMVEQVERRRSHGTGAV